MSDDFVVISDGKQKVEEPKNAKELVKSSGLDSNRILKKKVWEKVYDDFLEVNPHLTNHQKDELKTNFIKLVSACLCEEFI